MCACGEHRGCFWWGQGGPRCPEMQFIYVGHSPHIQLCPRHRAPQTEGRIGEIDALPGASEGVLHGDLFGREGHVPEFEVGDGTCQVITSSTNFTPKSE